MMGRGMFVLCVLVTYQDFHATPFVSLHRVHPSDHAFFTFNKDSRLYVHFSK